MGLKRVGILLFGVGVFVGSLAAVTPEVLGAVTSTNLVVGAAALAVVGLLVGLVGVARAELKWEP